MLPRSAAKAESHRMYKYIALEEKDVSNRQQGAWPILILAKDGDLCSKYVQNMVRGRNTEVRYELKTNHQVASLLQTW